MAARKSTDVVEDSAKTPRVRRTPIVPVVEQVRDVPAEAQVTRVSFYDKYVENWEIGKTYLVHLPTDDLDEVDAVLAGLRKAVQKVHPGKSCRKVGLTLGTNSADLYVSVRPFTPRPRKGSDN